MKNTTIMTLYRLLIKMVVVLGFAIAAYACNSKAEPEIVSLEYYYYPKTNMYFDVLKNNYLFSLDGAKTWDTIDARTQSEPIALGEKVVIYGGADSIWKDNEAHRMAYGGLVYNVVSDDDTAVSSRAVITEKKVTKKVIVAKQEEEPERKRKGLGKFLNKVFGKKKDKKQDK